jgi:hypothetical protein
MSDSCLAVVYFCVKYMLNQVEKEGKAILTLDRDWSFEMKH